MLYHRFYGLEPAGRLVAFDDPPRIRNTVFSDAKTLRARAAHCRALAGTFYDQSIVAELETFARELDVEAAALDTQSGSRSESDARDRESEQKTLANGTKRKNGVRD